MVHLFTEEHGAQNRGRQMISYAQNFEDVILARALSHIDEGFYIDIGAWSPHIDSVTKHFYNLGWKGINVEPNPAAFSEFISERVNDININVAISNKPGLSTLRILENTGLSTLDISVAKTHESSGVSFREVEVECKTLVQIFSSIEELTDIHFLKVDVEGYEEKVLLSNDWNRFRPWIVLIEATYPMTRIETYKEPEKVLLDNDYRFVYEDGLNRFYLDNSHLELHEKFRFPPNLFDGFVRYNDFIAQEQILVLQTLNSDLQEEILSSLKELEYQKIQLLHAEESAFTLQQILQSNSWRITSPLRMFSKFIKHKKRGI